MTLSLVSITIPTLNSAKTLDKCLKSIAESTYSNIEVIVVDGGSLDNTLEIAEKYGARVVRCDWKLLGARYVGFRESRGDYVLMLDADQVLEPTTVARAVDFLERYGYDMLVLEEQSLSNKGLLGELIQCDRLLIHQAV